MFIMIVISIAIVTCLINLFLDNSQQVKKFFKVSLASFLGIAFFFMFIMGNGELKTIIDFVNGIMYSLL